MSAPIPFTLRRAALKAPFPWFGGKSRVAPLIWARFGEVRNYVEPFFGSGAVLLARLGEPSIETVNDADAYLSNFWRAVAADPDAVAHHADWPVNEADLHARHRWLVETGAERLERIKTDPEYFDAKVAGWWVWGQCLWIGSGWCSRPEWTGRFKLSAKAHSGVLRESLPRKMPQIAGREGGRGAYAKSRSRDPEWEQRPHLGSDGKGQGITRPPEKLPLIAGDSKGVHADVVQKRPILTGNGGGNIGVHRQSLHQKRPVLQHGEGGRGVHRLSHQVPDLSGDAGAAGRGIHASRFEEKARALLSQQLPVLGNAHGAGQGVTKHTIQRGEGLQAYMRALSERLRRVRVCCGDFERILGPAVTTCIGLTGVLLDPPYDNDLRATCYNHDGPEAETGVSVWWRAYRWAIEHGGDPLLRIALCGYEHPDAQFPPGWTCVAWKASGGYGRSDRGKANARRERVWFSPHCLSAEQGSLW